MRKVLLPLVAAASVLAVASPAAAQAYGNLAPGYGHGYGARPYGNAYGNGYGYGYGNFQGQLQQIRNQAYTLMRQGRLTRAEANDLNRDIRNAENAMYREGRNGFSPNEARAIQNRLASLQYEVRRYSDYDGRRYYRGY